jgi:hypothetical protein
MPDGKSCSRALGVRDDSPVQMKADEHSVLAQTLMSRQHRPIRFIFLRDLVSSSCSATQNPKPRKSKSDGVLEDRPDGRVILLCSARLRSALSLLTC